MTKNQLLGNSFDYQRFLELHNIKRNFASLFISFSLCISPGKLKIFVRQIDTKDMIIC